MYDLNATRTCILDRLCMHTDGTCARVHTTSPGMLLGWPHNTSYFTLRLLAASYFGNTALPRLCLFGVWLKKGESRASGPATAFQLSCSTLLGIGLRHAPQLCTEHAPNSVHSIPRHTLQHAGHQALCSSCAAQPPGGHTLRAAPAPTAGLRR